MSSSISKNTLKRLAQDIKSLQKSPIEENGAFYIHSDENILLGYALIIGPKNTPYQGGFYLFKFDFPTDYPFSPPKLTYLTNDGVVRFHPNLYKNGKVCLSLLNTWKGEGWTSCQSIRSILLNLVSILDEEPLTKEPGLDNSHIDFNSYNEIIRYKNIDTAVCQIISLNIVPEIVKLFWDKIIINFNNNLDYYTNYLLNKETKILKTDVYCINIKANYKKIYDLIIKINNNQKKLI